MSEDLRRRIVETARAMNARGINQGTSGNVGARLSATPARFLVTPTAMSYDTMEPSDVVEIDAGGSATGKRAPSSEWRMHVGILSARSDVDAVVHTHSIAATALACLNRPIPPFHYMVAVAGGRDIRCAPYATFGTPALAGHALAALDGRRACLLANHGVLALGSTPERALALAAEVETLAAMYLRALAVGTPVLLDDVEMDRVLARFRDYAQPA